MATAAIPLFSKLLPYLITAGGAIGGTLLNRKSARTGTTSSSPTSTLAPVEPQEYSPLGALLRQLAMKRLESPAALPAGFVEGGIQNINRASDLSSQNVQNRLLGMGLSDSPVAANAAMTSDIARQGNINQLTNITAPLLEQELLQRDFGNALDIFGQRRVGTTATSTMTGTNITPGSALGAGVSDASDLLAMLYGRRIIGGRQSSTRTPG